MAYSPAPTFLVAAVQLSPVFLDREATIERAREALGGEIAVGF